MRKTGLLVISLLALHLCSHSQITLPDRMWADTAYAPFIHGVASGDPASDAVILWTRIDPPQGQTSALSVSYEVSEDLGFSNIVASGTVMTDSSLDWTVKIDQGGLSADQFYYYRFMDAQNQPSAVGRTRTAPMGNVPQVRFAVTSCSSIYSGYFGAYRSIGDRDDIHACIHLGDYVYDFVDQDEEVRVPSPYPTVPLLLDEWRERHKYYLFDPDLRYLRQRHPLILMWDNHDLGANLAPSIQAFHEYLPCRIPDSTDPGIFYRSLHYGDLVDVFMADIELHRDVDSVPGGGVSILGNDQYNWLSQQLTASTAKWKLICQQKMFGLWSTASLPAWFPFGNGQVADDNAWDGYMEARFRLLDLLEQNQIDNTIILSGDIHMAYLMDLPKDPLDGNTYNASTGDGSLAVEFLPTSITRGNFDEEGFGGLLAGIAKAASDLANPQHVYSELESHGYGILDLKPDSTVGEIWFNPILQYVPTATFETGYRVMDGENHWDRNALNDPTFLVSRQIPVGEAMIHPPFPNPASDQTTLSIRPEKGGIYRVDLCDIQGRPLISPHLNYLLPHQTTHIPLQWEHLPNGIYLIVVSNGNFRRSYRLSVSNN